MIEGPMFTSVWDALEDTPQAAARMRLCSDLMIALHDAIDGWHMSPEEASVRLGVAPPRVGDLLRGRISRFRLDDLVELADRAGLTIEVRAAAAE